MMRIIDCEPRSETWERLRHRPTASDFHSFITPVKGDYSQKKATDYAAKIVAKRLGVYVEAPPTDWMEWGTEQEPNAKHAYTLQTGREITNVGFAFPDDTTTFGGSPDGLVDPDGIIEIKCPKAETLIAYRKAGELPAKYKPQVQGLLLITGRAWCDFFVFHPQLEPFLIRIEPDEKYQLQIVKCLQLLLQEIADTEPMVRLQDHELVTPSPHTDEMEV